MIPSINIPKGKKVYFASDNHLGAPNLQESHKREKNFVRWLEEKQADAAAFFLLGDLFDFWFEYKKVVPRGFTRVLGKLAEISDAGIPIYFFVGNHDLWMNNYFEEELNIPVFFKPQDVKIQEKLFLLAHGDGLGPKDLGYKRMKKLFANRFAQWLFRWLHPDIGVRLAQHLSLKNKLISGSEDKVFRGEENEWLIQYAKRKLALKPYHYFIFGHRHLPIDHKLNKNARYINLGDWITNYTYGWFDGEQFELEKYQPS